MSIASADITPAPSTLSPRAEALVATARARIELRRLIAPARRSSWEADGVSCYPDCSTGTAFLGFNPHTRRMGPVPVWPKRLKDCSDCRDREWRQHQGRWLRHLWVEDDPMWVEWVPKLGLVLPPRPDRLWTGWGISLESWGRMWETGYKRMRARGEPSDTFTVTFDDGSLFVVASEDLSPRERLLAPFPPDEVWGMLGAVYTCEHVRRRKGRSMSEGWDVPARLRAGPRAAPQRLVRAVKEAGYEDSTVPEGVAWEDVAEEIAALLKAEEVAWAGDVSSAGEFRK